MALFDFLKGAGKKVKDKANIAAELRQAVLDKGVNITNLNVSVSGETATIQGIARDQKDRELARLIVGNHEGIEKVNDQLQLMAPVPQGGGTQTTTTAAESRMYTVKSGDTLSKIAQEVYGEASKYQQIFEANRPMLKDPDEIYPGQVLRIPAER
jgi:nucleoid-associated protein YgaU